MTGLSFGSVRPYHLVSFQPFPRHSPSTSPPFPCGLAGSSVASTALASTHRRLLPFSTPAGYDTATLFACLAAGQQGLHPAFTGPPQPWRRWAGGAWTSAAEIHRGHPPLLVYPYSHRRELRRFSGPPALKVSVWLLHQRCYPRLEARGVEPRPSPALRWFQPRPRRRGLSWS